jgi:hypothetical protein
MNHISTQQTGEFREATTHPPVAARRTLVLTAWIATLLLSKLPLVIARELLGTDIPWINPAWIVTAILLIAATYVWPALKPLRTYFAIMGTILAVSLFRQTSFWAAWVEGLTPMLAVLADRVMLVVETLIVLAVLFLFGFKRREAFLVAGDMKAPFGGQTTTTGKRRLSWAVLGTVMAILLGGLFYVFLSMQNPAGASNISAALPVLPLIGAHALWLTSLWFGLGHYYGGIPSGVVGLVYTGLLALLLGKAMLDTRGLGWSWIIHMAIDTVIYIFVRFKRRKLSRQARRKSPLCTTI